MTTTADWGVPSEGPVLLMLSGGLDSTTALYHCLQAGCAVHVHHVSLHSRRREREDHAVAKILKWCVAHGLKRFEFSGSSFAFGAWSETITGDGQQRKVPADDAPGHALILPDAAPVAVFIGALLRRHPEIRQVLVPRIANVLSPEFSAVESEWNEHCQRISTTIVQAIAGRQPVWLTPMATWDKGRVLAECPDTLAALTWSCRGSDSAVPCGRCAVCQARGDATRPPKPKGTFRTG